MKTFKNELTQMLFLNNIKTPKLKLGCPITTCHILVDQIKLLSMINNNNYQ